MILSADLLLCIGFNMSIGIIALLYFSQKKLVSVGLKPNITVILLLSLLFMGTCVVVFRLKQRLHYISDLFREIITVGKLLLQSKLTLLCAICLIAIITIIGFIQSYLYFLAFSVKPSLIDLSLAISLFGIVNMLPGIPFKIGQFEATGVLLLTYLLHINKNILFSVLFIQHAAGITFSIIAGWVALLLLHLRIRNMIPKRIYNNNIPMKKLASLFLNNNQ
jgi:hypothetical protein